MMANSFDNASVKYDDTFTNSCIGQSQRKAVWTQIDSNDFPENLNVLELNCGTGEDANRWSKRKMNVLATDISEGMINVAKAKFSNIDFKHLDINDCIEECTYKDIIFSNFGGFNCLTNSEIQNFFLKANQNLAPNACIILVIMGKKCIWDNLFLLLKGKFKELGRRNTNQSLEVSVDDKIVQTYYYSPKEIKNLAGLNFKMQKLKPIGFFVPPSYLSKWFTNKRWLLSILESKDKYLSLPFFSNYADHYYIQFTKRN